MAVTDLTNTNWLIKEAPAMSAGTMFRSINFVSNNTSYSTFTVNPTNQSISYGGRSVYTTSGGWIGETFRYVFITDGSAVTEQYLLNWFSRNATQIQIYTVTFDVQGHGTAPSPITGVISGSTISEPTAPTETGYIFGGWYKEQACTNAWNFSADTVTQDTTLWAKWTEEKKLYVGVDGQASKITKGYVGVGNQSRKITHAYIGVNNEAKKIF